MRPMVLLWIQRVLKRAVGGRPEHLGGACPDMGINGAGCGVRYANNRTNLVILLKSS